MKETDVIKQKLYLAKQIRQRSRTSCVQLENMMMYQQQYIESKSSMILSCNICGRSKSQTKKQFQRAFKTLSKIQQAQFFLMNCKNIQKFINTRTKKYGDQTIIIDEPPTLLQNITKIMISIKDGQQFKKFSQIQAQIHTKQKIIKLYKIKEEIDLHSFILRKSKGKIKNCIVLQSAQPFTYTQTIRLCFSGLDFQDSYNLIYKVWEEAQYENIKKILIEDNKYPRKSLGNNLSMPRSSLDIQMEPITNKLSFKKQELMSNEKIKDSFSLNQPSSAVRQAKLTKIENSLLSNDQIQSLNTFTLFNQQSFGIYYQKNGKKVRRLFYFSQKDISIMNLGLGIDQINHIKRRKPNIIQIKHLNSIPSQRTNIYRQIEQIQNKKYQFVYFRHYIVKNQITFYIQKSIDLLQFKNKPSDNILGKINYCIWRIKKLGNKIQVLAQADIQYNNNSNSKIMKQKDMHRITSAYIGQFTNLIKKQEQQQKQQSDDQIAIKSQEFQNQYLSEISNQEEFFTVSGSLNSNTYQEYANGNGGNQQIVGNMMHKKNNIIDSPVQKLVQQVGSRQTTEQTSPQSNDYYLRYKHQIIPKLKDTPIYVKQQGHLLFGKQWIITSTGQLVNINKQKIKAQSSVLKLVIQRMGKNFLSGRGIMNMSLPIQIFGIDSNIQRIARGFIYAPIFLQLAAQQKSPVQRMKNVFCFALGFSTSYIKMQKPFNPVVGQTYQGVIDGCPVYAEQISHHPPISSMLMIGRGYRAYGNFQAKIQMGLNSASGLNDGFNNIQFNNDKSIVKFNTCPGQMSGIIIGQRSLVLTKKSYFIDQKNMLFMQMHWGHQKNNTRPNSKLNDFFSGKIVKLKQETNIKQYKKIKQKHIQRQFGQIHGRFTGPVYYQDQLLFDLNADAPYLLEDYPPCLPSDSRYRKDIIERKKNNFNTAQDAKQQIEELQRADHKLRVKHKKH